MTKLLFPTLTLIAFPLLAFAACSDDPATPGGSSGNTGTSGGNGTSGGSGTSGGTVVDVKAGTIVLNQTIATIGPTTITSHQATASFFQGKTVVAGAPAGAECTTSTEGACTVTDCTIPENTGGDDAGSGSTSDAGSTKNPTAGEITISAAAELKLTPNDKGQYAPASGQTKVFDADQDVTFKAAGGEVPAFTKSLKAPGSITVTSPAGSFGAAPVDVDRAAGLEVKWTNGGAGKVLAAIIASGGARRFATLSCTYEGAAGTGAIPAAALNKLPAGTATYSVGASNVLAFEEGGWKITATIGGGGGAGALNLK